MHCSDDPIAETVRHYNWLPKLRLQWRTAATPFTNYCGSKLSVCWLQVNAFNRRLIHHLQSSSIQGLTTLLTVLHFSVFSVFSNVDCVHAVMLSNMPFLVFLYDVVQVKFPIWFPSPDSHISSSYARNMTAFFFDVLQQTSYKLLLSVVPIRLFKGQKGGWAPTQRTSVSMRNLLLLFVCPLCSPWHNILLNPYISNAWILLSSYFFIFQLPQPYIITVQSMRESSKDEF